MIFVIRLILLILLLLFVLVVVVNAGALSRDGDDLGLARSDGEYDGVCNVDDNVVGPNEAGDNLPRIPGDCLPRIPGEDGSGGSGVRGGGGRSGGRTENGGVVGGRFLLLLETAGGVRLPGLFAVCGKLGGVCPPG